MGVGRGKQNCRVEWLASDAALTRPLPSSLAPLAEWRIKAILETPPTAAVQDFLADGGEQLLGRLFACSDYLYQLASSQPALFWSAIEERDPLQEDPEPILRRLLPCSGTSDEDSVMRSLRLLRQRAQMRIVWRELAGLATVSQALRDSSIVADIVLSYAVDWLQQRLEEKWGVPRDRDGQRQQLIVLGLGKLGGQELNFSSDIDLIFVYPRQGRCDAAQGIENGAFFQRLAQRLLRLLSEVTVEGFVFRVDMRLRPFGNVGPLVSNFKNLQHYYLTQGRQWERYMLVKARDITGAADERRALMDILRPFCYRRYLDFTAFESLREIKQRIARERQEDSEHISVKHDRGGIRAVEFIVQTLQLVRGGCEKRLQSSALMTALQQISPRDLPAAVAEELATDYLFLRRVENQLQMHADLQLHHLPTQPLARAALAYGLQTPNWATCEAEIRACMMRVERHFQQTLGEQKGEQRLEMVWRGGLGAARQQQALAATGIAESEQVVERLNRWRTSMFYRHLSERGGQRMDRLIPLLLLEIVDKKEPLPALDRLWGLLQKIGHRSAYLSFLAESAAARQRLAQLCAASSWLASYLGQHPWLLDHLLHLRSEGVPQEMREVLHHRLQSQDGEERKWDELRYFRQEQVLQIAIADIAGRLPLAKVSDRLSDLAELILEQALEVAWKQTCARLPDTVVERGAFGIIAYGKLGGIELGYGSDIDLVFIHRDDGKEPSRRFFLRLAQTLLHYLGARSTAGFLYEVDTRLRPHGQAGPTVLAVHSLAGYLQQHAWTWELQALVRARLISGDASLRQAFADIRHRVLGMRRDREALRHEVLEMRQRMRREKILPGHCRDRVDLKQGLGGIVDIEFMVQYSVLGWACEQAELLDYSDNLSLIALLPQRGLLTVSQADTLAAVYQRHRERVHRLALAGLPDGLIEEGAADAAVAADLWNILMQANTEA